MDIIIKKTTMSKSGEVKIYKEKCECGKIISSLSKNQCDYNFKAHQLSCKNKEKKK